MASPHVPLDLHLVEAEQASDRRHRQPAITDGAQELDAGH
jgi:hypothetical protein